MTKRSTREDFARFFEEPTREGLREVLRNNLGEANEIDFKREWPEGSKLAKHVLGLANHGGGGCIVAGLEQTEGRLDPVGLLTLTDKTKLLDGIGGYLPDTLANQIEILDFPFPESEYPKLKGKVFQVLFVPDDPEHLPVLAARDGTHVSKTIFYTRRNAATVPVSNEDLQRIISRRLETGYSSRRELELREHLEQLRVLYEQLNRPDPSNSGSGFAVLLGGLFGVSDLAKKVYESSPESFNRFVTQLIERKKRRIVSELDV